MHPLYNNNTKMKTKLNGDDIKHIGFREGKPIGIAQAIMEQNYNTLTPEEKLVILKDVLQNPTCFLTDQILAPLAHELVKPADETIALTEQEKAYEIYGAAGIEQGALTQMNIAMKLPVTVAGALMPDAHQGYGLPIGGVLATRNAVIPYGVGVDIGCRMCMTLYDLPVGALDERKDDFKKMLMNNTMFGRATFKRPKDHEIFERPEFKELSIVRKMKDRAWQQIGSSGGGNHFVEFGIVEIMSAINEFNLPVGKYVALLSHSGS